MERIIKIYNSYHEFKRLIHLTNIDNFINIYKESFIKPRSKLENFKDFADETQISKQKLIKREIMDYARFYLRTNTPTYYRMYQKESFNPVMIILPADYLIEYQDKVAFTGKHLLSGGVIKTDLEEVLKFEYNKIFSNERTYSNNSFKDFIWTGNYKLYIDEQQVIIHDQEKDEYLRFINPDRIEIQAGVPFNYVIGKNYLIIKKKTDDMQYKHAEVLFKDGVILNDTVNYIFKSKEGLKDCCSKLGLENPPKNFIVSEEYFSDSKSIRQKELIEDFDLPF